jgi:hypothetical protein
VNERSVLIRRDSPEYIELKKSFHITTIREIYSAPPLEFLIEGLIYKNTLNLIDAFYKVGKTILCTDIAVAVSQGSPLFGIFKVNCPPGSCVLIVDQENPKPILRARLQGMEVPIDNESIHYLHFERVQLDLVECFDMLVEVVERLKPVLIIFDSLKRFHSSDENSSSEMSIVMGRLRELVNMGTTVLVQHHQGYSVGRPRGSSDIGGAVDSEFTMTKHGTGTDAYIVLENSQPRLEPAETIRLKIIAVHGQPRMKPIGTGELPATINLEPELLKFITDSEEMVSLEEISAWMKQMEFKGGVVARHDALQDLVKNKKISEHPGPHNKLSYSSFHLVKTKTDKTDN